MNRALAMIPLFLAASMLLGTNGLLGTLIPIRGTIENFSPFIIGMLGSAYYTGFVMGCLLVPKMVSHVGHIRSFAALAAAAACFVLLTLVYVDGVFWVVMRVGTGMCFAGKFMVLESWLSVVSPKESRARLLSFYRIIDVISVSLGNYVLVILDPADFVIFVFIGIFYVASLIPISAFRQPTPKIPKNIGKLNPLYVFHLSPLAFSGALIAGLTNAVFRALGPVFGQDTGMTTGQIATFINMMILGSVITQFPFGWFADRYDRRVALLVATVGAMVGAFLVVQATPLIQTHLWVIMAGVFMFGAFSLPIYTLSLAHANDFADKKDYVKVSATLLLTFSVGGMLGPIISLPFVSIFGSKGLFVYITTVHCFFLVYGLHRFLEGRVKPKGNKIEYANTMRTSISPLMTEQVENKVIASKKEKKSTLDKK